MWWSHKSRSSASVWREPRGVSVPSVTSQWADSAETLWTKSMRFEMGTKCFSVHRPSHRPGRLCSERVFWDSCVCLAHAFVPEADSGFRQSQASRIWRELEEEEEGHNHRDAVGFFQSVLRRKQRPTGRGEAEEEEDGAEGAVPLYRWGKSSRRRRRSESGYSEDDCRWFFVLATLMAALVLFVSLVYPLLSKLGLRHG